MSEHQAQTVQPQQPEEITPVANTANQPASPEAGHPPAQITLPEPVTIKSVAEAYIDHLTLGGQTKMSTINIYTAALQLAANHFGADRRIDSIQAVHVGRYYNSSEVNTLPNGRPKATPTIKQIRRVFRQMMEFAQTYGLIQKLPIPASELQHARRKQAPIEAAADPVEASQSEAHVPTEVAKPEAA